MCGVNVNAPFSNLNQYYAPLMTEKEKILITGGCGFLGSAVANFLASEGFRIVVCDNFARGNHVDDQVLKYYSVDLLDVKKLKNIFAIEKDITAVIHLAALAYVQESVANPNEYFLNNIVATQNVINVMHESAVKKLIFTSSMAVYGNHASILEESFKCTPINPYGQSKLIAEILIEEASKCFELSACIMRLPNLYGVIPEKGIREMHKPETHLIPNLISALAQDSFNPDFHETLKLYGEDEEDLKNIVRDFIHLRDVVQAMNLALNSLLLQTRVLSNVFNLSSGHGTSIYDLVQIVERVSRQKVHYKLAGKRIGDPTFLLGSAEKFRNQFKWTPRISLDEGIREMWNQK